MAPILCRSRIVLVALAVAAALAACASHRPAPETRLPDGSYVALEHHGTNPVIDTDEQGAVRLGLSGDRASWMLVHHYLAHGEMPPPEAVRVEDCIRAMAPAPRPAPRNHARPLGLDATIAPSPFRKGWHALVVTVATSDATTTGSEAAPTVVSEDPGAALETALSEHGARIVRGDAGALPAQLSHAERVIFIGDGAGLGGVDAQAALLAAVGTFRARGGILSVVGRLRPGMDDALLDRLAYVGGGVHEIALPRHERSLAAELMRPPGLSGAIAEVRFEPTAVRRWRLVGHESRVARPPLMPIGGLVPAGTGIYLLFEVDLAGAPDAANGADLGSVKVSSDQATLAIPIAPAPADAAHRAVVAIAAFAEKLRGSYWGRDVSWDALAGEVARLGTPAARAELGDLVQRARALAIDEARGIESPVDTWRALP